MIRHPFRSDQDSGVPQLGFDPRGSLVPTRVCSRPRQLTACGVVRAACGFFSLSGVSQLTRRSFRRLAEAETALAPLEFSKSCQELILAEGVERAAYFFTDAAFGCRRFGFRHILEQRAVLVIRHPFRSLQKCAAKDSSSFCVELGSSIFGESFDGLWGSSRLAHFRVAQELQSA